MKHSSNCTYLSLVYAALIGYFIWGDVPDEWKICGAALIVGAGIFILYREGQQKAVSWSNYDQNGSLLLYKRFSKTGAHKSEDRK